MENSKTCTNTDFNKQTGALADAIVETIDDMVDYWPLTVRQVFYQLVAKQKVKNHHPQYQRVSRVLVKLRELEEVPWIAITDRTRRTTDKRGLSNIQEYLENVADYIFNPSYYGRCRVQGQVVYAEVSTEKDALSSIMEEVLWPFCVRLNVIRGQNSATLTNQIAERMAEASMRGQSPVLLHFGDLDASGIAIPKAIQKNLAARHGVTADVRTIALTPEQVREYKLPTSVDAFKPNDPNYKTWLKIMGRDQPMVELDALHPETLRTVLYNALAGVLNMDQYDEQKRVEMLERNTLGAIRKETFNFLKKTWPEYFEHITI